MVISSATWQRNFGAAPTVTADPATTQRASFSSSSAPREGVATSDVTQAAAGTSTVQTFSSTINVPWTLQTIALTPAGGTLAFSAAPDLPNLPGLTLNGSQQTLTAALPNFAVDDETGSESGWNVTVAGDNAAGKSPVFRRYCPNGGGCGADAQGYPVGGASFAASSLTLNSTGASFTGGVGTAPALQCGSPCALDVTSGATPVASAASGGAAATWTTTGFGASSVSLAAPTTVRALPASEVYRVDLIWTLGTGP
jgi:hypothetical protein